jgi:two-component system, OmpR family, response regulator
MRILLVEDEKKVASFISKALREAGHAVDAVHDGNDALDQASTTPYEVIILDIMLPGRDGLSVLKLLRERRVATPVLVLTARGEVSERIEGLQLGADDYMAKPFAMGELMARVNALGRRSTPNRATLLKVHDLTLNLLSREVRRAGRLVELALREYTLLEFLMRSAGRVLSRTRICESVWEHNFETAANVVDVYINRLRRKIDDGNEVKLLQTVRGVGYVLKGPE